MKKSNIVLIGMPGAGKSTAGVVLAKKLGMQFVDTDLIIQAGIDKPLCEVISKDGNAAFLKIENEVLAGLQCKRHVIATGGSAIYGNEAMENLRKNGTVVFLDASFQEICSHLKLNPNDSDNESASLLERAVILPDNMSLQDIYKQRLPLYRKYADITIKTDGLDVYETVEAIVQELQDFD